MFLVRNTEYCTEEKINLVIFFVDHALFFICYFGVVPFPLTFLLPKKKEETLGIILIVYVYKIYSENL